MHFTFDFSFHLIGLITYLLAWVVIGLLIYRIYKKKQEKLKVWKILIITFIGLFSFSINLTPYIKLALFPLGVLILYFCFVIKDVQRWRSYRVYAWIGFLANYLFLNASLLAAPLEEVVYPPNDIETYISKFDNPSIIRIHPTGKNVSLNEEVFESQLHKFRPESIDSPRWYNDIVLQEPREERFPYQLIGASPKWGSGLDSIIYIEEDGKGLLLRSSQGQLYFRNDMSVIREVSNNE